VLLYVAYMLQKCPLTSRKAYSGAAAPSHVAFSMTNSKPHLPHLLGSVYDRNDSILRAGVFSIVAADCRIFGSTATMRKTPCLAACQGPSLRCQFCAVRGLKRLRLGGGIVQLPSSHGALTRMTRLIIAQNATEHNQHVSLPASMTALTALYRSSNRPAALGCCSRAAACVSSSGWRCSS